MELKLDDRALRQMIKESPETVRRNSLVFIRDITNEVWRKVNNTAPWRVGGQGGGVPYDTGNLRMAHRKDIAPFEGKISVNSNKTKSGKYDYAKLVHDGTPKGQMKARPWLIHGKEQAQGKIEVHKQRFLKNLVKELPRK